MALSTGPSCNPLTKGSAEFREPFRSPGPSFQALRIRLLPVFYFARSRENFVDFVSGFAWEFSIEECRGFLVNLFGSAFPMKRSTKTPRKSRSKIRGNFSGGKFEKFGELLFCNLSDLTVLAADCRTHCDDHWSSFD